MSWFIVALGAPFVWSLVNHCDKIILSRYFKGGGSGGLMIFVGVVSIPTAIFILMIDSGVLMIDPDTSFKLIVSGILYNFGAYIYLKMLEHEDASYVVAYMSLIPVFSYFLGTIFLNEQVSNSKLIASLIVIFGALLLSFKLKDLKYAFNVRAILFMVPWALILSVTNLLFKQSLNAETSFITGLFWNQIGMIIFASAFFADRLFRKNFINAIMNNSSGVLMLNIVEQVFELLGVIINNYAILLAPLAMVMLVEYTFQPIFVFIIGIILTLCFPKMVKEDIAIPSLIHKFISIAFMSVGLYIILH